MSLPLKRGYEGENMYDGASSIMPRWYIYSEEFVFRAHVTTDKLEEAERKLASDDGVSERVTVM
jgi:hypothetical protein